MNLLINKRTKKQIDSFILHPYHGLLIVGQRGSGKSTLLSFVASNLLGITELKLDSYPHLLRITPEKNKSITVEQIRDIDHFVSRKVPGKNNDIKRLILIDDAEYMGVEAQNALLKNLEEPPEDTVFILTSSDQTKILPTIRSRALLISIDKPDKNDLEAYLKTLSNDPELIKQAINISGGLAGLAVAIASDSTDHPLVKAAITSRQILSANTYERLIQVNHLSKDIQLIRDSLGLIKLMASIAMETADANQVKKWHNILTLAYDTEQKLLNNTNIKLNLTNFMVNLP